MDSINNHLIPHISKKKMAKEMFDTLVILYENKNIKKKKALHNILRFVDMARSNIVTNYLAKVTQISDQVKQLGRILKTKCNIPSEHD